MAVPPRTYLFVPGNRPDRFDKALASGADAVILDLEDAVAPDDKSSARDAVAARLRAAGPEERRRLLVRINDEATPWFDADLAFVAGSPLATVMLPKAEKPETIDRLRAANPGVDVLALVETARGVLAVEALAATRSVSRLAFGTLDFALDLGLSGDPIGFDPAASRIALASRAADLPAPVAGVTPALDDEAQLGADLARARAHGFGAKLCIHPRQVEPVHRALRATDQELAWARRVIEAAAAGGSGAVQLDGRMVDRPVLERARALLARGG
jgi:citrate lyase subunit beta / citryl-CoA lyase